MGGPRQVLHARHDPARRGQAAAARQTR